MVVRERASRALSMPVAFSVAAAAGLLVASAKGWAASSWDRSSVPLDFLGAVLALAPFGVERCDFSSSASRASRSAFFWEASAFFSASASLGVRGGRC